MFGGIVGSPTCRCHICFRLVLPGKQRRLMSSTVRMSAGDFTSASRAWNKKSPRLCTCQWRGPIHTSKNHFTCLFKSKIQMRKKFCNYLPEGKTQTTSTNVTSKVRRVANMTCQLGHMRSHEASCKKGAWSILHWNDRSIKHPAKKELWASCHTQRSFEHPANQAALMQPRLLLNLLGSCFFIFASPNRAEPATLCNSCPCKTFLF